MTARFLIVCLTAAALLAGNAVRADEKPQVQIELRYVSFPSNLPLCPVATGVAAKGDDCHWMAFLDEKKAYQLLEAIQADRHANIMQAPRVRTLSGQMAKIEVGAPQTFVSGLKMQWDGEYMIAQPVTDTIALGVKIAIKPTVSKDNRFVRVHLKSDMTDLQQEPVVAIGIKDEASGVTETIQKPKVNHVRVHQTFTVPDGGTAVLDGGKRMCASECECPILSRIPYINRLFKCMRTEQVLVLVTPRIVVKEKEEVYSTGFDSSRVPEEEPKPAIDPIDDPFPANPWSKPAAQPDLDVSNPSPDNLALSPAFIGYSSFGLLGAVAMTNAHNDPVPPTKPTMPLEDQGPPSDVEVLQALPQNACIPCIYEEARDDVLIAKSRDVNTVDEPRFFPMVGVARLHHVHWKCTIGYTLKIVSSYPFPFQSLKPCVQVVYLDRDYLEPVK